MRRAYVPSILTLVALGAAVAAQAITYAEPDLDRFGPPCTLTVNVTGSSDRLLSWDSVSGASTYWVGFRRCDGSNEVLAIVTGTSYTHSGFDPEECLEYLLVAYDAGGTKVCAARADRVGTKCPCP